MAIERNRDEALAKLVDQWAEDAPDGRDASMFAWRRANVGEINRLARERMVARWSGGGARARRCGRSPLLGRGPDRHPGSHRPGSDRHLGTGRVIRRSTAPPQSLLWRWKTAGGSGWTGDQLADQAGPRLRHHSPPEPGCHPRHRPCLRGRGRAGAGLRGHVQSQGGEPPLPGGP